MALTNVVTEVTLDVYNHDTTQTTVKSIALDSETRFVKASLQNDGVDYSVDADASVTLTVLRPDGVGVQITGSVVTVPTSDLSADMNGVQAELTQAALATKGMLKAQFKITSGDQILRTEIFLVSNGTALDAETSTWVDTYDGFNLDEMTADITTLQTETGASGISGDGVTDVTSLIEAVLADSKICTLGAGDFVIGNLTMPDGTMLKGAGDATRLYFDTSATGSAIKMGSRCTVKDLTLYGAETDITIPPSDFVPSVGTTNFIGSRTIGDGYVKYNLTQTLSAGAYRIVINATSDTTDRDTVNVKTVKTDSYSTANVLTTTNVTKDVETTFDITVDDPIQSIWIYAENTAGASQGYTVTVTSVAIYEITELIGNRYGIEWSTESVTTGTVENCRVERFTGAGLLMMDTGTDVDHNLFVSNCYFRNSVIGIYIRRDSEYHKISNCVVSECWYGLLNRGGNNNISCCGFDGNVVGIELDADEGSNGGHGAITGCSINHSDENTGYGLIIRGTGREMVSGCNIMRSKVLLKGSSGNVISGCGFMNTVWEIDGGGCSVFASCMVNTGGVTITVTNNTKYKIVNCYTRGGVEVTA